MFTSFPITRSSANLIIYAQEITPKESIQGKVSRRLETPVRIFRGELQILLQLRGNIELLLSISIRHEGLGSF